jgi:hypothetical protein
MKNNMAKIKNPDEASLPGFEKFGKYIWCV